jgi:hypothetical protein
MSHAFWIFWAVTIPLTFLILLFFVFWINREKLFLHRETWSGYRRLKNDEEDATPSKQVEQSRAPNPTPSKRRTSSIQRERRLSIAEAEKWNTLQDILRDHPANSSDNYYQTPQVHVKKPQYHPPQPSSLTSVQEESSQNSSQQNDQVTTNPQPTTKTAATSPSPTTNITTTPRPTRLGPREMISSVGWDAEELELEYANLIRYISTDHDRRYSSKVKFFQDDDHRYGYKSAVPSRLRRWHFL